MSKSKSKAKFFSIISIAAFLLAGCSQATDQGLITDVNIDANLLEYIAESYTFQYPEGYTVVPATQSFHALIVEKARNKRLEIFKMSDFGERPWGFEPEEGEISQAEIDGYVPREMLTVKSGENAYDVWLFYGEDDEETKNDLQIIFKSIEIK